MKSLSVQEQGKLHGWYTELWNSEMHKSIEPGWCLTDALVKLFGVEACRKAIKTLPDNIGE